MKVSVAVMAHPRRADLVADLIDRLGVDDSHVVWDRYQDRWDTGVRSWQAHDPAADWHLVIQDDALVAIDLLAGLENALDDVPAKSVVSLYLGSNGPRSLTAPDPSWVTFARLIWGVAVAVPVVTIADMLAWCERNPQPNYDTRISRYYERVLRWPVYYAWPSLVDHRQGQSLLDHPNGRRARDFIGERISALDWPPAHPQVLSSTAESSNIQEGIFMTDLLIAAKNAVIVGKNAGGRRSQTKIKEGKLYRSDDPVVKGREHLFRPVEDTTAVPGEKRSVRKPRKKAQAKPAAPAVTEPEADESDAETSESE